MREIIIIIFVILLSISSCMNTSFKDREKLGKEAVAYFCEKYDLNEKEIEVTKNSLLSQEDYDSEPLHLSGGFENFMFISYQNEKYRIDYDMHDKVFSDNYQCQQIIDDFNKYLTNKYPKISSIDVSFFDYDIRRTPAKYEGDIPTYMKQLKPEKTVNGPSYIYTTVKISINCKDADEAKSLHENMATKLVKELDSFKINYVVKVSSYFSYSARDDSFDFSDNVEKWNSFSCNRSEINSRLK